MSFFASFGGGAGGGGGANDPELWEKANRQRDGVTQFLDILSRVKGDPVILSKMRTGLVFTLNDVNTMSGLARILFRGSKRRLVDFIVALYRRQRYPPQHDYVLGEEDYAAEVKQSLALILADEREKRGGGIGDAPLRELGDRRRGNMQLAVDGREAVAADVNAQLAQMVDGDEDTQALSDGDEAGTEPTRPFGGDSVGDRTVRLSVASLQTYA